MLPSFIIFVVLLFFRKNDLDVLVSLLDADDDLLLEEGFCVLHEFHFDVQQGVL